MRDQGIEKTCPRCGAKFRCLHGTPQAAACQCTGIKLTAAQLEFLRSGYDGCLCRSCLIDISELPL